MSQSVSIGGISGEDLRAERRPASAAGGGSVRVAAVRRAPCRRTSDYKLDILMIAPVAAAGRPVCVPAKLVERPPI